MTVFLLSLLSHTAHAQNVVGGAQVAAGDWEDTAGIVYNGNSVGCTGVLVAPRVALTAGHCVRGISHVLLGTNDYTRGGELIRVEQTIEYPRSQSTYDAAVLILAADAETEPRMIAQDCILDRYHKDGASVTIVGYGATDNYGYQYGSVLNEATTTVDDHDCTRFSSGCVSAISPGGELGAGAEDEVDSCYGDSGGPLYLRTPKGDYLVGLTSRAYNTATIDCGQGGIYVRPDAIIDWIEEVSGASLPRPDCDGGGDDDDDDDDDGGGGGGGSGGGGGGGDANAAPAPTANGITVVAGGQARTVVEANDADAGDSHTFSVISEPQHGAVTIDGSGVLTFSADNNYSGGDELVVVVTDDGGASGEVTVDIAVRARGKASSESWEASGCSAAGGVGSWGLVWLALLGVARRRARSGS